MMETTVMQWAGLGIVTAVLIYIAALIASTAFFRAKFEYHKRLSKALMKGDHLHD